MDIESLYSRWPKLSKLRDDVARTFTLEYRVSQDAGWGANAEGNTGFVVCGRGAMHPECCLAHELLHLLIQSRGYRRLRASLLSFDNTNWGVRFFEGIDNELQHHRMFPLYRELGFDSRWFYADDDRSTARHLEASLAGDDPGLKIIALEYLTVIAPGGHTTNDQAESFRNRFHRRWRGKYADKLAEVDLAFQEWRAQTDLNAEEAIRRIVRVFEHPTKSWLSYVAPPTCAADGFFV